ncbi:multiple sugar transport system substrate-binding protein [Hamadaea flava]|uniref:ABC transporter substrate-binding protein n=1 Tax=Hamadaea flava TaxID=1742688 RepID=A0ABV8LZG5_9ACTN|nr:extracellular solute-binding protein [Hamadaea flava]MCP2325786.1 multiple sugar transport system substrate-binding protein [Hamadaea flava]
MKPTAPLAVGAHSPLHNGSASRRTLLRGIAAAALAAPAAAVLAACGDDKPSNDPNAPVELSIFWWGGDARAKMTEDALALYTAKHPNVTFKKTWQANAGYYDKLATLTAGGNAPDIFQIDDGALSEYAERNQTLDLSKYADSNKLDKSKILPGLWQAGVVEGKAAGVPMGENTPGMIYDKGLLKTLGLPEPTTGMTWDALIAWAAQVTSKSGGKVFGTMDPSADYKALWVWLRQQGKQLYDGKKVGASAEDLTKWFDLWKGARDTKAAPPADVIHGANAGAVANQLVVTGKAATSFMWANQLPELQKATKSELGVVAYPGDPSGQWARAALYFSIYKGSKHADVAVDVLNFLVNDVEAGKVLGTDRGLNANTDVRTAVASTLKDAAATAAQFETDLASKFGQPPTVPPKGHVKVRSLLITYAENVQYGKATSAAAADAFLKEANAALAG